MANKRKMKIKFKVKKWIIGKKKQDVCIPLPLEKKKQYFGYQKIKNKLNFWNFFDIINIGFLEMRKSIFANSQQILYLEIKINTTIFVFYNCVKFVFG